MVEFSVEGERVKTNGERKAVIYIVYELLSGGELFDFIAETGPFSEEVSRFFFK